MKKVILLLSVLLLCIITLYAVGQSERPGEAVPPSFVPVQTPGVSPVPRPTSRPTAGPTLQPIPTQPSSPDPVETPRPAPKPTAQPEPAPAPTPVQPEVPSEEAVLSAYAMAVEAYSWFESAPLPVGAETVELDGAVYSRVDYPGITTLNDLRLRLKALFSDEIVETLMARNTPHYREVDGVLYVMDGGRGSDVTKGGETLLVDWESTLRCSVQVTVQLLDPDQDFAVTGTEVHRFPYEKVGDKWIFTEFYLYR